MTLTQPMPLLEPKVDHHLDKNNPREVFGWKIYDWANSAFYTTVVGALYGPYLTQLTQQAVGENGVVLSLGQLGSLTANSFFPVCVSVGVVLQVFLVPVRGAIVGSRNLNTRV